MEIVENELDVEMWGSWGTFIKTSALIWRLLIASRKYGNVKDRHH